MLDNLAPYFSDLKKDFDKHVKLDLSILFLILVFCVLYVALTYQLPEGLRVILLSFDYVILGLFVIEFFLSIYL